ncbi:MAG: penicillin acylase family protein [Cytophagales bacterium]|nr:penicillin acylase family protein [Cytophagales bacterium]
MEVLYDDYGVPHIYAQNDEDAYYALGYVHAQDRLFQMEMIRRPVGGRLSEILGPDLAKDRQTLSAHWTSNGFTREQAKNFSADTARPF